MFRASGCKGKLGWFSPYEVDHVCRVDTEEDPHDLCRFYPRCYLSQSVMLFLCLERPLHRCRPHHSKFLSDKSEVLCHCMERKQLLHPAQFTLFKRWHINVIKIELWESEQRHLWKSQGSKSISKSIWWEVILNIIILTLHILLTNKFLASLCP